MTRKPRILMIENDPDFVSLLQPMLEKLAVEVVVAEDGAHARDALASSSFDLVTLAYRLPDSDGLELLKQIRSKDQHVPVILQSPRIPPLSYISYSCHEARRLA